MKNSRILNITLVFAVLFSALIYYFLFTAKGLSAIAKFALSRYLQPQNISIEAIEGNLLNRLTFQGIEAQDLKGIPPGNILKIQKLDVYFTTLALKGLSVNIDNGRLKIPASEPMLFYGSYRDSLLDINIYSKHLWLEQIFDVFSRGRSLRNISGAISDLDIYVKGPFLTPELTGTFLINQLSRNRFSLTGCAGSLSLSFKDINDEPKIFGEVALSSGEISGPKTNVIKLKPSKIIFSGNPGTPALDLKGVSNVEGTTINLVLKGTFAQPDLQLKSQPAMAQERLLLMLATGKSWKGAEAALSQNKISADLARDFLDYFVFAGSADKIAKRFGISSISLKYDGQAKGLGVNKAVSEKLQASYKVEQSGTKSGSSSATHKLGGEYKVTETTSVGVEKEVAQDKTKSEEQPATNGKVILRYKKEF